MTTEEAISWLRQIDERYIHGGDEGFDNHRKEAIETAIAALRAIHRLGKFGQLFLDYKGCPRGATGRSGLPLEEEVLSMPKIRDIDGGEWIPANADALAELVDRYKTLRDKQQEEMNPGEVSDGYHTFNELYHHRAVLFSVICNQRPERAWKSRKHHDGTMYDGMFIVGIETPEGQATYHYDIDPYWDMFRVPELECAPQWDGHTPAEAIRRVGTLAEAEENANVLTNADRIRAMSDEELAEFLGRVKDPCNYCQLAVVAGACTETLCDDAMMNWLREPAEEGAK